MVLGAAVEWDPVPWRPREIVARVTLNRLQEAEHEPDVQGEYVVGHKEWSEHRAEAKEDGLHGVRILSRNAKRR